MPLSNEFALAAMKGALPWKDAAQLHIEAFLRLYTLHDSHWVELNVDCAYDDSAVAAIWLDPVWNPSAVASSSDAGNCPELFIRFSSVSSVRLSGFQDIGHTQHGISDVTVTTISEEEVSTIFSDHYGAVVCIQHFSLIEVLIMSPQGKLIPVAADNKDAI